MLKGKGSRHGSHSVRNVNTRISAEMLVGDLWHEVAYAELMRLSLEVNVYHIQLKGKPGFTETGQAFEALQAACEALADEYSEEQSELL